jgi:integrase
MGRGTGVRAASSSSIAISFEYRGVQCREKVKLAPTEANLKHCRNLKARIEHDIAIGTFDYVNYFPRSRKAKVFAKNPAQLVTVGQLLTDWLANVRPQLEPETYADYAEYVAHTWRPLLATVRLSDLTMDVITDWIAAQKTSRKRILNLLTPLRQAVRYAVSPRKLLSIDPLARIKVQRPPGIREKVVDPFSAAELEAILPKLEPQVANMVQFWVWTGMRQGEVIALTWADIDFDRGVATVNKAARGKRRKAPKTRAGNREVKLLPPALEALQRQKAYTRLLHREVFLDPGTRPVGNDKAKPRAPAAWTADKQIRVRWVAALAAAGIRYRPPKQLRHTYATWMLMAREDPLWVAGQMGHADVSITLKVYAKYIPAMNPDAGMQAWRSITATKPDVQRS